MVDQLTSPADTPNPIKPEINAPPLEITGSRQFPAWLAEQGISIAFTTYQSNRLLLLGLKPNGQLSAVLRTFERPMGLVATTNRLYLSSKEQIWQLDNLLEPGQQHNGHDQLYLPRLAYTTGDLDIHDLALVDPQWLPEAAASLPPLVFIATRFSCLATLSPRYNFQPLWQPSFIDKLTPEDRCHLNGLAIVAGQPRYVTAVSRSDVADGWRDNRSDGGCVIDVQTNEVILTGLSMPHSPRWYRDKLWLLNSGTGEFGYVDVESGVKSQKPPLLPCPPAPLLPCSPSFTPLTFCPGYLRGLAFWDHYAIVGLSRPREATFSGLPLEQRLAAKGASPRCGLLVIDLDSGDILHWVRLEGGIDELYDVQVLPQVRSPTAARLQRQVFTADSESGHLRHWYAAPSQP